MTRRPTRAALLAAAVPSLRARNAPPAPAKRPGRGSARPAPPDARTGPLDAAAGVVVVELPGLRLVNPLNNRQGWRAVSERGRREKGAVGAALRGHRPPALPVVVTITRISPGRLDSDGAVASGKHVRDAVAAWLRLDDADERVTWVVTQAKGAAGVRIAVGPRVARRVRCPGCGCGVVVDSEETGR